MSSIKSSKNVKCKQKARKRKEKKSKKLAELQKKKLAEKIFVSQQESPLDEADDSGLEEKTHCYICKVVLEENHFFYDSMCMNCGSFNYEMRSKKKDLTGYTAIVTGGRVKI